MSTSCEEDERRYTKKKADSKSIVNYKRANPEDENQARKAVVIKKRVKFI